MSTLASKGFSVAAAVLLLLGGGFGLFCQWRLSLEACRTSWWLLMAYGGFFIAGVASLMLLVGGVARLRRAS